jgi:hypothetical protein
MFVSTVNLTLSGDGSSGSFVGNKIEKPSEVSVDVKANVIGYHFIFEYTKGSEDGFTAGFYWSDPDNKDNAKIAILETDDGALIPLVRTLSASLDGPSSFSIPIPACAEYAWVKITKNGSGEATGAIIVEGDYDSFKERG